MMNCIIVHGCPDDSNDPDYNKHWIPWVKDQLTAKGAAVQVPLMPKHWKPVYEDFKKEFEKYKVGPGTVLVGHSCGSAFLVRWLGETKTKVQKLILVAPWKIPFRGDDKEFYIYPIDKTIKSRVKEVVMFTSDNEENKGKVSLGVFHKALGGKIVELKSHGHYTENDMGTVEFPELLKVIIPS